jgi:hypothetical protein
MHAHRRNPVPGAAKAEFDRPSVRQGHACIPRAFEWINNGCQRYRHARLAPTVACICLCGGSRLSQRRRAPDQPFRRPGFRCEEGTHAQVGVGFRVCRQPRPIRTAHSLINFEGMPRRSNRSSSPPLAQLRYRVPSCTQQLLPALAVAAHGVSCSCSVADASICGPPCSHWLRTCRSCGQGLA